MYGLTVRQFHGIFDAQGRVCAICQTDDWGAKGPVVDHCHSTGAVRGILCGNCNVGIGNLRDDPARLRAAADYLDREVSVDAEDFRPDSVDGAHR
jgi:hypothetical protein